MRCWTRSISILAVFLATTAFTAEMKSPPTGNVVDRIVAVVNGQPILLSELDEAKGQFRTEMLRQKKDDELKEPEFGKKVLDQLINDRLVGQEIEHRGFMANDAFVDRAIDGVMQQNGFRSADDLRKALRDEGMSLEEYRVNVKKQIETSRLVNAVVRPKVQVNDQDVDAALRTAGTKTEGQWKVDVWMIYKTKPKGTKKGVTRLRREIGAGVPFELVAKRETEGPAKSEGGHIGLVLPSDLQTELRKPLETLNVGQLSDVIETKKGFYLLQVTDRQRATAPVLSIDREKTRENLEKKELDRNFDTFIRGLREKAHVEVML
ncbi:MAG: SurA N-terminal domain-containing protein [Pseudomonadota bacterium]